VLQKETAAHLRRNRTVRRSRHRSQKNDNHGRIVNSVSISDRPATVEDRALPRHWEGDLLFDSHNRQIAMLLERHSRPG
jgi:IS30 family transposase